MTRREKAVLKIGIAVLLIAVLSFKFWQTDERRWIREVKRTLSSLGPPPPRFVEGINGEWGNGYWLIFENGWACFTSRTSHSLEDPRDIALLRTQRGRYYLSHHHFCLGSGEFDLQPKPKDIEVFLLRYQEKQGWELVSGN